ncbi:MAG: hypothetical protein IT349_10940, partial [Candidatus Eisenbacteria bacterium]|nr:hypothetical protein [Candidatus Eisenbacteria bacterium]
GAAEPEDGDLGVFLRWEQLAAYARGGVLNDWTFRGTERARKNWSERGRLVLAGEGEAQILSKQRTYGLWGLYTGPARSSGLVEGDPTRLTAAARGLVEEVYLPTLTAAGIRNGDEIVRRLARRRVELDVHGRDGTFLAGVAKILDRKLGRKEREFLWKCLACGGDVDRTSGVQPVVAKRMASHRDLQDLGMSRSFTLELAKRCRPHGIVGVMAAERLERCERAESVLAPAAVLFGHLLHADGQTLEEVATGVRRRWGSRVRRIEPDRVAEIERDLGDASTNSGVGARWVEIARSLAEGNYGRSLSLLLEQNAHVMRTRSGGAPWVDIQDGRLRVRLREEAREDLPERGELADYWRHSYFIDSLYVVASATGAA